MFAHRGVFHFIGRLFFVFWHITGENCKPQAKPRADRGSASRPYAEPDLWGAAFLRTAASTSGACRGCTAMTVISCVPERRRGKRYESIGIGEKVLPQPLRDSSDPHRFSRLIVWGASKPIRILAQKYFFISPNTSG